jgi:putative transposase
MPHTYSSILLHVVFSTKERRALIDTPLEERLYPYLGAIMRSFGRLHAINGVHDHVHLLLALNPAAGASDVLRELKSCSSKWVRETFPERRLFAWQRGFAAFSVSKSNLPAVARYIERQKEHHEKLTFRDEYLELLKVHGITVDERYLFS